MGLILVWLQRAAATRPLMTLARDVSCTGQWLQDRSYSSAKEPIDPVRERRLSREAGSKAALEFKGGGEERTANVNQSTARKKGEREKERGRKCVAGFLGCGSPSL